MIKAKKLKSKKVKGRIKVLKALPYKGSMVYIRMIGEDIFEYLVVFNGEIYSNYLIMRPKKGIVKLTENEINQSVALIFSGAVATIDTLLGEEISEDKKNVVSEFEGNRQAVEGLPAV